MFDLVQKLNKHVSYGMHNLELESILKELGITSQNKPLTLSDTRFAQYAYFALRNFLNSYPAIIKQMEYELSYSNNEVLQETLEEATSLQFIVTVLGATDIFRRQQIMSQQSQKVDQLISNVFGNTKIQVEKLKLIKEDLKSDKHPDNWDETDINKLDDHLMNETKKGLSEIIKENKYKGIKINRETELDMAVAIVELRNHLTRNIFALEDRFKEEFNSDFVEEVKDSFDFNYMVDLKEQVEDSDKTLQEAFDEVEEHGNSAVKFLLLRQSKSNPTSNEEMAKVIKEYKEVKDYAFKTLMGIEMDRKMCIIKEHALEETAVFYSCHRRFNIKKVLKHNKDMHKGELTQFGDKVVKYSSIKIVHGICKEEQLFNDKKKILSLALKVFCKTPNESVVECIGSIAELHTKPQRNCNFKRFETELLVDWNGPIIHKAQSFLEKSLDRHFGSRKK